MRRIHLYSPYTKILNHLYPSQIFISLIFIKAPAITTLASDIRKIKVNKNKKVKA